MNDLIEKKYYDVWKRIRLAIREGDDIPEDGNLPITMDGIPIRKLFVSNLADRTTHKDLAARFSRYGVVENCFLKRNIGKNNYAFVTFSDVKEALSALADGERKKIMLHSRDLRVMPADSWHQPDSLENQQRSERKNSNEQLEKAENNTESYATINDANSCINTLNNDCLIHIFLYLPIVDRVRIERVCKRWQILSKETWRSMQTLDLSHATWGFSLNDNRRVINANRLRKVLILCGKFLNHINITDYSHELSPSTLTIIAKMCKNIQTIDVTALTVSTSGISSLEEHCKGITKFCLGRSTSPCDYQLQMLFFKNNKIRYFEITRNDFSGKCLDYLSPDSLEELHLSMCSYLEDYYLANALINFRNLRILTIVHCIGVNSQVIEVIGKYCNNLKTLQLVGSFSQVLPEDIMHLVKLVGLESLKVGPSNRVTDDFLVKLASNCRQLKHINVCGNMSVTDTGIAALATLPKLEFLAVNGMSITANGLQEMGNLRHFECQQCTNIYDEGATSLIKCSPNLELLDLSGCTNVTNSTLEFAMAFVNVRTNNTILKMYVGGTSIVLGQMMHIPPFLQIVNVDLSVGTLNVSDVRRSAAPDNM